MKPWLFFDFDGTILDIREKFYNLYVDCLQELGGNPISQMQYWNLKHNKTKEFDILKTSNNEDLFDVYEKNRLEKIESIDYLKFDSVWPGLVDELAQLRESNQMSIVTLRKSASNLEWQIDHLGLTSLFSHVICSGENTTTATGYETKVNLVNTTFGIGKYSGWFMGDTEVDILAGKALGMKTCAVGFGLRPLDLLNTLHPDKSLDTPDEFLIFLNSISKNPDK